MDELHRWLQEQQEQRKVEPNSSLGQAIKYLLKHWDPLTLFLRVPGVPLDNNLCEQALKMAIRHRKNSLSYKTQRGADVGDDARIGHLERTSADRHVIGCRRR